MVFRYCTTDCIYNLIKSVWKCVLQAEEIVADIKYKHLVRRLRQELSCSKTFEINGYEKTPYWIYEVW